VASFQPLVSATLATGYGFLYFRLSNVPQVSNLLKGLVMSNENKAVLLDSSNLDAWKKSAAKSAPGGDIEAMNWVTPEGVVVQVGIEGAHQQRFAVGIEDTTDIIADLDQALASIPEWELEVAWEERFRS